MKIKLLTVVFLATLLYGCSGKKETDSQIRIMRLDQEIASGSVSDSLRSGAELLAGVMSRVRGVSVPMEELSVDRSTIMFQKAIDEHLPDLSPAEKIIGKAKKRYTDIFGDSVFPHIYGVVLPVPQSIITSDSIILVGLNHYLGNDFEGYNGFPEYQRERKIISRLPIDIFEAQLTSLYPFSPKANVTVLQRMLYEGALLYNMKQIFPDYNISAIMGISQEDEKWLDKNLKPAYHSIINQKLLFSSDPTIIAKIFNPAPASTPIAVDAPQMSGKYIGLKMVESYMKSHTDISSEQLLNPDFYTSENTLQETGFNP